jgi:D-lactate dehydrogenase
VDLIAFASDASFYRLIPKAVVFPRSTEEVRAIFRVSRELNIPMTFRAAGTSLSGQAVSDGILVEVARHWRGIKVIDGGGGIQVQPGVIGAHVNHALRPYRAKMGPDPASLNTCTVGGILSNNSSGMCCGVVQNAFHTLESMTFLLPSGNIFNTRDADADLRFRALEPALADGLTQLKAEIEGNSVLADRIRAKYRLKNTTGYSLNAFIDYQRPIEIFSHLLVGSEGTLAFIAEAVLRSVPDLPVKVTGFLLFPDLHAACAAIPTLRDAGAAALEAFLPPSKPCPRVLQPFCRSSRGRTRPSAWDWSGWPCRQRRPSRSSSRPVSPTILRNRPSTGRSAPARFPPWEPCASEAPPSSSRMWPSRWSAWRMPPRI